MRIAGIKWHSIADGYGVRISLYVSGCRRHCKGCHNPEAWNFDYGQEYTHDIEEKILVHLRKSYIAGLSLLGGEPFEPENENTLENLLMRVKSECFNKNIWAYTGFLYEEIKHSKLMKYIDVLVDGDYQENQRDVSLPFRGSRNQRILKISH